MTNKDIPMFKFDTFMSKVTRNIDTIATEKNNTFIAISLTLDSIHFDASSIKSSYFLL